MKIRRTLIALSVLLTTILLGALIYLPLTGSGCPGEPACCPKIHVDSFTHTSIICHPSCKGGGKVEVYGSMGFYKQEELCEPPANFSIYIYNKTDGVTLPQLEINPGKTGVYAFKKVFDLDHDAEFELRAEGEESCVKAAVKFKVRVLKPGEIETYHLIYTQKKNWPLESLEWHSYETFGKNIILDRVVNENKFKTDVEAVFLKMHLDEKGSSGNSYEAYPQHKMEARGDWIVRIPNESEFKKYSSQGQPPLEFAINVRCECP
jgi:hypothetical protein